MNLIPISNTSYIIPDLYIGIGSYSKGVVECYICGNNHYQIEGYHLFLLYDEGIELSFAIGEDADEEDDDIVLRPPIDTDHMNCNCLRITGVDEL